MNSLQKHVIHITDRIIISLEVLNWSKGELFQMINSIANRR